MTLDDHFRDQISRGQPPLVALHNAAQAYAESLKPRDCSQYADETASWSEPEEYAPQDSEAVELLCESRRLLEAASDRPCYTSDEIDWIDRYRKFLEWKR